MGLFKKIGKLFSSTEEIGPAVKPERNDLCWCGSGKKYKKCHLPEDDRKTEKNSCSLNCGPS